MKIGIRIIGDATPTPEMIEFFEERTREHIERVKKNLEILTEHFDVLDPEAGFQRGEDHDASKYEADNWLSYVWCTWWHKNDEDDSIYPPGVKELVRDATGRHIQNERHHPQYYQQEHDPPEYYGGFQAMQPLDVAEMVADWMAMDEELEGGIDSWLDETLPKYEFEPEQLDLIYEMVGVLKEGR